ncbi:MAG TPA: PfkB family carbohydrate kinase [Gaiellaceae bacterium]|nr:PfkB family carbohydrate kinase [Gaiellaceae bacterium]
MRPLGVIGHLSSDAVEGAARRIGGGPWHAGRALRTLGQHALLAAKCGVEERPSFLRRLATLGLPVTVAAEGETTAFSFSYDAGGARTMAVDAIGEPWRVEELPASFARVEWVQVAPLLRGDFPVEVLERLARGRRLLFDGQGLVRARAAGPLSLDGDFEPELLRFVTVLKLAEEEAQALLGGAPLEELRGLGVPEVVVTFGLEGSLVLTRSVSERIRANPVRADPTGAGDAFSAAYLAGRASGHSPVSAARRASALVAALLAGARR